MNISFIPEKQFEVSNETENINSNNNFNIENTENVSKTNKIIRRKRQCNKESWKRNVRQKLRQAGEEYINSRGKLVPKKTITMKKNCLTSCKFKCETKVTKDERLTLFKKIYELNQQGKNEFICKMTCRNETVRKTTTNSSRRQYSFTYFVEILGIRIQVCKLFWLGTFAISQKAIYNIHNNKDKFTNTPKNNER